jgi:hypothetical protein
VFLTVRKPGRQICARLVAVLALIINPGTTPRAFDQSQVIKHRLLDLAQRFKFFFVQVHFSPAAQ